MDSKDLLQHARDQQRVGDILGDLVATMEDVAETARLHGDDTVAQDLGQMVHQVKSWGLTRRREAGRLRVEIQRQMELHAD